MRKTILPGLALCVLIATGATAAPQADAPRARAIAIAAPLQPLHAVLRYDASAYQSCRSFSDTSSEVCLLLALHVIRMSQRPLAGTGSSAIAP